MEGNRGSLDAEVSRSARELPEVWNGIDHPIKEPDSKFLEKRSGEQRKERFQVSARTLEPKPVEVRKCDPRHNRCTR